MTTEKFVVIMIALMVLHGLIVILCFLRFKKRSLQTKILGINFLCLFLSYHSVDLFTLRGMEVNIPANIEILTSFLTLTAVYYTEFRRRHTWFFLAMVVLFTIFWVSNIFLIQKTYFNSYSASASNFIVIAYCVTYFYRLMGDLPERHLRDVPMFWISTGVLIQGAAATFLYLFMPYLTQYFFDDVVIYWTFYCLIGIVQLFLIIVGVLLDLRNVMMQRAKYV